MTKPLRLLAMAMWVASSQTHAQVAITARPGPHEVRTSDYQAVVGWDGCLTELAVDGSEFLAAGVGISRGGYFYQAEVLQLNEVQQLSADTISAKSPRASVTYEFAKRQVTVDLRNLSKAPMVYFLVCSSSLDAVRSDLGKIVQPAITAGTEGLTLFQGGHAVEVQGISKAWGPWERAHQVIEIKLEPNELKQIRLDIRQVRPEERQKIAKMFVPPDDEPITVLSPRDFQVFQRHRANAGQVLISGRCQPEVDVMEVRITGDSAHGALPKGWQTIAPFSDLHEFHLSLELPAGGWYRADLRAKKSGKLIAEASVEHFGVGEVFVGAGQSNSTNCGQFKTKSSSGRVSSFGGLSWQLANDPQPGAADDSQGGSFWPAFGDSMYEQHKVPIGVAVTGFGGTSVNQWQPDDELFEWMMKRVHQLGPRGFRALLWHQGESDIEMPSDEYFSKLHNIIDASRARAGWEFPWFVAQASYHNATNPRYENIRSAQRRLWEHGIALQGPDTDTLTEDHRDFDGEGIHLSPKGLKAHGQMWAEHVNRYLDEAN